MSSLSGCCTSGVKCIIVTITAEMTSKKHVAKVVALVSNEHDLQNQHRNVVYYFKKMSNLLLLL